jgi:hypothetical protein
VEQLSKTQQEKIINRISSLWKQPKNCEICGTANWSVVDRIYQIMEFSAGNLMLGGPIIPFVVLSCNTCGNTHFLNAISLKVVDATTGKVVDG